MNLFFNISIRQYFNLPISQYHPPGILLQQKITNFRSQCIPVMRLFLLSVLSLFFVAPRCFCQAWEKTNALVLKLTQEQRYDSALSLAKKGLSIAEKESGKVSLAYAATLNNLAVIYKNLLKFDLAESSALESAQIVRKVLKENDPDFSRCLENLAELYEDIGKYDKAEAVYLELCGITKNYAGENSVDFLSQQQNLAELYETTKEYKKAEPLFISIMETSRKMSGDTSANYVESMSNLGRLCFEEHDYKKAEALLLEVLAIRKKSLGENHPDYASTLFDLGALHDETNAFDKAESEYLEAMQIWKNYLEDFHDDFTSVFVSLAKLYNRTGKYRMTVSLYPQVVKAAQKVTGPRHINVAAIMHETARAYSYLARYDSAIALFRTSTHIEESMEGGTSTKEFANNMYHMGQAFTMAGEYDSARFFLNEAEKIRKKIAGEESYDYAASLYGLGYLDIETGDFPNAEKRLLACRNILKAIKGQKSADYALCNSALANLYIELNMLEKAEPLLLETLTTEEEVLGKNHPTYASTLNDIGGFYDEWGDIDKAEKYYLQALKIRETTLGKFHSAYAESLNNLAGVYADKQEYDKAIALYTEASDVIKKIVGENHGDYSNVLSNMALAYERMGNYTKAESLLMSANEINRKVLGEEHPQYSITLRNLALVYLDDQKYDQAESALKKAINIQFHQTRNNFSMLTEKEKTSLIDYDFAGMYLENNLLLREKNKSLELLKSNFDQLLFLKSVSLFDTRNLITSIRNNTNPTVRNLFGKWQELRSLLAKQYSLPLANRMAGMDSVEQQAADIEKKLNDLNSAFRKQRQALEIRTKDIQLNLRDDEVAIEFVNFNLLTTQLTDTILYAAYVLNKKDPAPVFVPLCREDQLTKYFSSAMGSSGIKSIYRSEVADEDSTTPVSGDSLFSLVWKPLLPYLKGVKKINFSPAGLLNRIAFHALPIGNNRLLIDEYELDRYTSIRQLSSLDKESKTKNTSITLFGDPVFTVDSASVVKHATTRGNVSTIYSSAISRDGGNEPWVRLAGTGKEIRDISSQFLKNGIATAVYTQEDATEEKFKSLNGTSPTVLHVATHGFFLSNPQKKNKEGFSMDRRNAFTIAEDPMLRSGIVLAGADRVWVGKPPIENREDGIVTAFEISQLDLRNTDLVVLSACETALGDIKGTEGVFGLQRAFKLAGVKNMLLSLWKVPDEETAELMRTFYGYYLKGETSREALKNAQKDLRKKYSPYYWAAFVLIE